MNWLKFVFCVMVALVVGCRSDVTGPDRPPVANAGDDLIIEKGQIASLSGSESYDPEGRSLSYLWSILTKPAESAAELSSTTGKTTSFVADQEGIYHISLVVSDGKQSSQLDLVRVQCVATGCQGDQDCLDDNACDLDRCVDNLCVHEAKTDGTACDDQDWCTIEDACLAGLCQGNPRDCSALDDLCNLGVCDSSLLSCGKSPKADGAECDDGLFCTMDDACLEGECTGNERDCSEQSDVCNEGFCIEEQDQCGSQALVNGTQCDDFDDCTVNDSCSSGVCLGQPADADEDGYQSLECGGHDCDDQRVEVNPGQFEGGFAQAPCADQLDNDCDGLTDGDDNTCKQCVSDSDCADGNLCNGEEVCQGVICSVSQPPNCDDGNICTDDTCLPETGCLNTPNQVACDDGEFCTLNDSCFQGACVGSASPCQVECLTECDEEQDACVASPPNKPCTDDGQFCNGMEFCNGVGECISPGSECEEEGCRHCNESADNCFDPVGVGCDDGVFCNGADSCDGQGECNHAGNPCSQEVCNHCNEEQGHCFDDSGADCDDGVHCNGMDTCNGSGECLHSGNPCSLEDCNHCNENQQHCFDDIGTACLSDNILCTVDSCDGAGTCRHVASDEICTELGAGSMCLPSCFSSESGCGEAPVALNLHCQPSLMDPLSQNTSDCILDLGLSGQRDCLSCQGEYGYLTVDASDFGDVDGRCSLDGWRLVTQDTCSDSLTSCVVESSDKLCCKDFSSLCTQIDGRFVLQTDKDTNCGGGGYEQWRISKTFDTRGLHGLEICLDILNLGTNENKGIYVVAQSQTQTQQTVFCLNGPPRTEVEGVFYRLCESLPAQYEDLADLTLMIVAHSDNAGELLAIDSVALKAVSDGCSPDVHQVFVEDFGVCPGNPDSEWMLIGSVACAGSVDFGCYDNSSRLMVENNATVIYRSVDASALDDDVQLCFYYGDFHAEENESLHVLIDSGNGVQTVWSHLGDAGEDETCEQICVNLSDIEPGVRNNPHVSIAFQLHSNELNRVLHLDQISLVGLRNCPFDDNLTVSDLVDQNDGSYALTAQNDSGAQLKTSLFCAWGEPEYAD